MGKEQRITELLLGYWNIIKGGRVFPAQDDVNPEDIPGVWKNCFIVSAEGTPENREYHYIYMGDLIENSNDELLTPDNVQPLTSPFPAKLISKYADVIRTKSPIMEEDEFVNTAGKIIRYRQILLPLGPNDDETTHILGGMRYKMFDS